MQAVGSALDDADLVVQSLDEAEGDLVLGLAVGGNAVPVPLDQGCELLERLQALPLELGAPVGEELARPGLAGVLPQLAEGFLQDVRGVEPLVGGQQKLEVLAGGALEILRMRQQRLLLAFDERARLALQARVFLLSDLVERLAEMSEDVELVEQDGRLRRVAVGGGAKRFPHIHHRQADPLGRLLAEECVELIHARLAAIRATEPDRPMLLQVAHHDAVLVPLAHRDLVDADHLGACLAGSLQLLAHVLFLQPLDRVPVQALLPGNVGDRAAAAALPNVAGEALAVQRVLQEILQSFPLHGAAAAALNPPHLQIQVNAVLPAGQVSCPSAASVVPAPVRGSAGPADRFFPRRTRVTTRACGSPKIPCTVCRGRKPGNRYASASRRALRVLAIRKSCQNLAPLQRPSYAVKPGLPASLWPRLYPLEITKSRSWNRGLEISPGLLRQLSERELGLGVDIYVDYDEGPAQ